MHGFMVVECKTKPLNTAKRFHEDDSLRRLNPDTRMRGVLETRYNEAQAHRPIMDHPQQKSPR